MGALKSKQNIKELHNFSIGKNSKHFHDDKYNSKNKKIKSNKNNRGTQQQKQSVIAQKKKLTQNQQVLGPSQNSIKNQQDLKQKHKKELTIISQESAEYRQLSQFNPSIEKRKNKASAEFLKNYNTIESVNFTQTTPLSTSQQKKQKINSEPIERNELLQTPQIKGANFSWSDFTNSLKSLKISIKKQPSLKQQNEINNIASPSTKQSNKYSNIQPQDQIIKKTSNQQQQEEQESFKNLLSLQNLPSYLKRIGYRHSQISKDLSSIKNPTQNSYFPVEQNILNQIKYEQQPDIRQKFYKRNGKVQKLLYF